MRYVAGEDVNTVGSFWEFWNVMGNSNGFSFSSR